LETFRTEEIIRGTDETMLNNNYKLCINEGGRGMTATGNV